MQQRVIIIPCQNVAYIPVKEKETRPYSSEIYNLVYYQYLELNSKTARDFRTHILLPW